MKTKIRKEGTTRKSKRAKPRSQSRRNSLAESILANNQNLRVKISAAVLGVLIVLLICALLWRSEVGPALLSVIGLGLWRIADARH